MLGVSCRIVLSVQRHVRRLIPYCLSGGVVLSDREH